MILLIDRLKTIVSTRTGQNRLWVRTLLKEPIQDYILHFVYNSSKYKQFIFTGGTALRKLYGLPRLSEDLDFDLRHVIDIEEFTKDLQVYIVEKLMYKDVMTKIAANEQSVFLKFPKLLSEIGFAKTGHESKQLIVRCDLSLEMLGNYDTEVRSITIQNTVFFVEGYDLSTLFANKIIAFLKRTFFRGEKQKISFKGRDLFDLVWLLERSIGSNMQFQPNWERVYKAMGTRDRKKILQQILTKTESIKKEDLANDLIPFLEPSTVQAFRENFQLVLSTQINNFLKWLP